MSLNYDVGKVEDWVKKLERDKGLLETICFGQLTILYPNETDSDVAESNWRYRFLDETNSFVGSWGNKPFNPDLEDLLKWKGLKTNNVKQTRSVWLKDRMELLTRRINDKLGIRNPQKTARR